MGEGLISILEGEIVFATCGASVESSFLYAKMQKKMKI